MVESSYEWQTRWLKKKLLDYDAISVGQVNGKEVWKPKSRSYMIGMKPEDIMAQYNAEIRGFYNYYSIANNISYLGNSFGFNMEYSMFKTIAQKAKQHTCTDN